MKKLIRYFKRLFSFDKVIPVSIIFGFDRGKPIDRYYIENFISANKILILGNVLEVEDNFYTLKYGNKIIKSFILKYNNESKLENDYLYGDLTDINTLPSQMFDLFICTQTLNFIFDVEKAINSIHQLLKNDGIALVTVACITQISRYDANKWGDYWRFTPQGIKKLFENKFGENNVEINVYGNSYSATHFLKGYSSDEINVKKLNEIDEDYPVVIALKITKK